MPKCLTLRPLTEEETPVIHRLAHARTEPARTVERAQIVWRAHLGARVPAIARALGRSEATIRLWLTRFNAQGVAGLRDGASRLAPAVGKGQLLPAHAGGRNGSESASPTGFQVFRWPLVGELRCRRGAHGIGFRHDIDRHLDFVVTEVEESR